MEIQTIGVAGAGKMGHGIALSAAMAGYPVVLHDRTDEDLARAKINIDNQIKKWIQKDVMTSLEGDKVKARIQPATRFDDLAAMDLVIEAVPENLDLKMTIFKQLDALCKNKAIIVSNTSTFSITTLASATQRPEQVAGMHFFIPPTKLVEITRGHYTSDETVYHLKVLAESMGRICVEVKKDSPGFIANRIYTPLLLEAFKIYEEGVASKEDIDLAMKNSYLPVGPFELADIIGLDVIKRSLDYYQSELGPTWNPPQSLKHLVREGRLGKKVGKGWYDY